jgi:putative transposase
VKKVSVLVTIGAAHSGHRVILGVSEGAKEDGPGWRAFLRELKRCGLRGLELFVSDKCPGAGGERGRVLFGGEAATLCGAFLSHRVHGGARRQGERLKAIHAQEDAQAAKEKARQVAAELREIRLAKAAEIVEVGVDQTLSYYCMPPEHTRRIKTNNPLEQLLRENPAKAIYCACPQKRAKWFACFSCGSCSPRPDYSGSRIAIPRSHGC